MPGCGVAAMADVRGLLATFPSHSATPPCLFLEPAHDLFSDAVCSFCWGEKLVLSVIASQFV